MRRTALEHPRTLHRHRCWLMLANARGIPAGAPDVNRFRKQLRVGGCCKSRCWLCHADKLTGRPTLPQRRHLLSLAEGVRELDGARDVDG